MSRRGYSVVEAMVAAALAGVALAGLAGVACVATMSLRLARDTGTAVALASERLEALRLGPRSDGDDLWTAPDGTVFVRRWRQAGGRGRPATLSARVTWARHAVELGTEATP
jgi:Tfp pilus assembly protein PilV